MSGRLCYVVLPLVMATQLSLAGQEADWQRIGDAAVHRDPTTALFSLSQYQGPYSLLLKKDEAGRLVAEATKDGVLRKSWRINPYGTPFLVIDNNLYYTVISGSEAGGTVVAFDLETRKELWRAELEAMGTPDHSKYTNFGVSLSFERGALRIDGKESQGKYIEFIEPQQGTTLVNRVIRP